MPELPPDTRADIVFIGAGPKTTGILLALAATENAGAGLRIHLIDPYPPGAGRIWRTAQSPHLWMNSRTEDITMFPDVGCRLERLPVYGPSLDEWIHGEGRPRLAEAGLGEEARALDSQSFASRRVQGHYLEWALEVALDHLAASVHVHRCLAESIGRLPDRGFRVMTSEGSILRTTVLVSAQGHLDMRPAETDTPFQDAARTRAGLYYQRPGFTADLDFSAIPPAVDVLVRGFGLAFVDFMVVMTQGRGGEFFECDGRLRYRASGREPVLWVGSSRGVPYSPKLGYSRADIPQAPVVSLRYLIAERLDDLSRTGAMSAEYEDPSIDFRTVIGPLAELELTYAHYEHVLWKRDLLGTVLGDTSPATGETAPGTRVLEEIDATAERILETAGDVDNLETLRTGRLRVATLAASILHDPADLFDLASLDRPFDRAAFASLDDSEDAVRTYIEDRLQRSANVHHSADLAVFDALVKSYVAIRQLVRSGRVSVRDRIRYVEGSFHSLFSYIGSGPPPERIRQILALHDAGLLRFLGPGLQVEVTEEGFRAGSSAHPDAAMFTYFVEARLARQSAARAADPALESLGTCGAVLLEGDAAADAKLRTDDRSRALDSGGRSQQDLFLLGPAVSGATAEAFTRPNTDAPVFKDNERVASAILESLGRRARGSVADAGRESLRDDAHSLHTFRVPVGDTKEVSMHRL